MTDIISPADLPGDLASNAMTDAWVDGANARASRVAPCLASLDPVPTDDQLAEARLILIGAIQRWSQAGSGAFQQQNAGPFGVTIDTRQRGGYNLWPSEITQLQDICKNGTEGKAFAVDTAPRGYSAHSLICSLNFGATYCSCGADIARVPIFECDI